MMPLNVIELLDSVINNTQILLDELDQEDVHQRIATLLKAAQDIHTELIKHAAADGSITDVPRVAGYYVRTPFGIFETSVYVMKKKAEKAMISLSAEQLQRLESMDTKMNAVKNRLNETWA